MIKLCQWIRDDERNCLRCTECGRLFQGTELKPIANCGQHKAHGSTMRLAIDLPLRPKPEPPKEAETVKPIENLAAAKPIKENNRPCNCGSKREMTADEIAQRLKRIEDAQERNRIRNEKKARPR